MWCVEDRTASSCDGALSAEVEFVVGGRTSRGRRHKVFDQNVEETMLQSEGDRNNELLNCSMCASKWIGYPVFLSRVHNWFFVD